MRKAMHAVQRAIAIVAISLGGAAVGFVAGGAATATPSADHANHFYHSDRHVGSLHGGGKEDWCAERIGEAHPGTASVASPITSFTLTEIQGRVDNTVRLDNPTGDWHRANSDARIVFNLGATAKNCTELSTATRDAMDIEFWAWGPNSDDVADITSICGAASSCVYPRASEKYTNNVGPIVHDDYNKLEVHLLYSQVNGSGSCDANGICQRRGVINHEVGHVLGLDDCHASQSCGPDGVMHQASY